jgi:hypothetical protein
MKVYCFNCSFIESRYDSGCQCALDDAFSGYGCKIKKIKNIDKYRPRKCNYYKRKWWKFWV